MKRFVISIVVLFFTTLAGGITFAASDKCTVVSIDDKRLVIECEKPGKKFKEGDRIKIKTTKNKKQIEGC